MNEASLKFTILSKLIQFLFAIAVTVVFFSMLSYLSRPMNGVKKIRKNQAVLVSLRKPHPPPDVDRYERHKPKAKNQLKRKRVRRSRPGVELLRSNQTGGIIIDSILEHEFEAPDFDFKVGYNLDEIDAAPVVTHQQSPMYPYHAKREGIEGIVTVRFLVTTEGKVVDISIIKSNPDRIFDDATRQSVAHWKFKPGIKDGEAIDTWVEIDIEFELDKS